MNTSEVLHRAADLIEERGWVQVTDTPLGTCTWGTHGGGLCMEGGIMAAAGIERSRDLPGCTAYRAVWDYLQSDARWGVFRNRVYDWNDVTGRTTTEVIEVLRATAVIEAARESEAASVRVQVAR